MILLYNIGIFFYKLAIIIASPFNLKAKQWRLGRVKIFKKIKKTYTPKKNNIWFHAASLGEFEQGRPVIEAYKAKHPDHNIIVTFFSPSGYNIRKNYTEANYIFYLPLDTKKNADKFVKLIQPTKVIFIKYEFWYHYLFTLQKNNIPTYIISAIFRPSQIFFKFYGIWYRQVLQNITTIFVQDENSKILLEHYGFKNVKISGDTRFDRVVAISNSTKNIKIIQEFVQSKNTIIAGSTWEADEKLLAQYYENNKPNCKIIIAPHEIPEINIKRIEKLFVNKTIRYTQANSENIISKDILIIDTIGLLSSLYKYGSLAIIGGGFGKGIHNTLEAATFGLPILFGPNYQKFQEAIDLIKYKGAFTYQNFSDFEQLLSKILHDKSLQKKHGNFAQNYVNNKTGATQTIMQDTA